MKPQRVASCKCGCGGFASPNRSYVAGHNIRDKNKITPAGMSYARAYEITLAVFDSGRFESWLPRRALDGDAA